MVEKISTSSLVMLAASFFICHVKKQTHEHINATENSTCVIIVHMDKEPLIVHK